MVLPFFLLVSHKKNLWVFLTPLFFYYTSNESQKFLLTPLSKHTNTQPLFTISSTTTLAWVTSLSHLDYNILLLGLFVSTFASSTHSDLNKGKVTLLKLKCQWYHILSIWNLPKGSEYTQNKNPCPHKVSHPLPPLTSDLLNYYTTPLPPTPSPPTLASWLLLMPKRQALPPENDKANPL